MSMHFLCSHNDNCHTLAGSRSSTGSRASLKSELKLGAERLDCLVLKREEGAPEQTPAEYQLLLDLENHSEAMKFVAHRSLSAHQVKQPNP
jgi:hypothetical protein